MQNALIRKEIGKSVYINCVKDEKFKSNRITLCFVAPLKKETTTVNALVPFVLRKGCKSCPDFTTLNKKLADMYGAILDADVQRHADLQIIEVSIQFIDDRYAISGENMTEIATNLLYDIAFEPNLDEEGLFPKIDLELEKEYLIDTIESELNDKRIYAIGKALDTVFENEPFAVKRYGYTDIAKKITGKELALAWQNLVKTAQIEIMFTGPGNFSVAEKVFKERIKNVIRKPIAFTRAEILPYSEFKSEEETMDIAQGKLVMAFRMGAPKTEQEKNSARVMAALYGGTAFSKLFMNVREKMSLCYYASASFMRTVGVMLVDSGIEFENREKAQSEILHQLDDMVSGNFTEEDLINTKSAITNSLGSMGDTLGTVESWYLTGILEDNIITPIEDAEGIKKITREDVIKAAEKAKLASVFFLKGGKTE